jgi:hypothetical protein
LFTLTRVAIVIANVTIEKIIPMPTIGTKTFMYLRALYALILLSIYIISVGKNEIRMMNGDADD